MYLFIRHISFALCFLLLAATTYELEITEKLRTLHTECDELTRILATIHRNSQK